MKNTNKNTDKSVYFSTIYWPFHVSLDAYNFTKNGLVRKYFSRILLKL